MASGDAGVKAHSSLPRVPLYPKKFQEPFPNLSTIYKQGSNMSCRLHWRVLAFYQGNSKSQLVKEHVQSDGSLLHLVHCVRLHFGGQECSHEHDRHINQRKEGCSSFPRPHSVSLCHQSQRDLTLRQFYLCIFIPWLKAKGSQWLLELLELVLYWSNCLSNSLEVDPQGLSSLQPLKGPCFLVKSRLTISSGARAFPHHCFPTRFLES